MPENCLMPLNELRLKNVSFSIVQLLWVYVLEKQALGLNDHLAWSVKELFGVASETVRPCFSLALT